MSPPDLEQPVLWSLLGGGFVAAVLHAALPTHWLPFVLVGQVQRWNLARTLGAVGAAAFAHIVSTAAVGGLIVAAGLALDQWVAGLLPWASAALLFAFGAYYLLSATRARPVAASGPDPQATRPMVSNRAALLGLIAMMALSPGEVLLPIYLSSADEGLNLLALLTLVFLVGTVLGMAIFTTLARAGASILRLERWARYEGAVLGLALIALGLFVVMHQH